MRESRSWRKSEPRTESLRVSAFAAHRDALINISSPRGAKVLQCCSGRWSGTTCQCAKSPGERHFEPSGLEIGDRYRARAKLRGWSRSGAADWGDVRCLSGRSAFGPVRAAQQRAVLVILTATARCSPTLAAKSRRWLREPTPAAPSHAGGVRPRSGGRLPCVTCSSNQSVADSDGLLARTGESRCSEQSVALDRGLLARAGRWLPLRLAAASSGKPPRQRLDRCRRRCCDA